ncbi:MAG: response regulator, partial [Proteobacteria bacterium]|nr:response regulator [Pseudomonadota bacterium]
PGQPRYRIMIVEDQHENQLLLSQLMTELGLDVKVAANGQQCLELFQDWCPDLIWMDRRMPVMDGIEATQRLRRLPDGQTVKIVAVTASAFKEQQQEMLDVGMDDFVRKPYRFDEIYDCLARQLGLEYVYRSGVSEEQAVPVALTPAMLAALPAALRQELREALVRLDSERITASIQQVGEVDVELASALFLLADNFEYSGILKALDEIGD